MAILKPERDDFFGGGDNDGVWADRQGKAFRAVELSQRKTLQQKEYSLAAGQYLI